MNYGGTPVMLEILGSTRVPYASSGNGGILGCSGLGYGAGGGVGSINSINVKKDSTATSINIYAVPGKCGDMTIGIFDLALNQSVACTVGTSVKPSITASSLLTYIKAADSSVTEVTSDPTIIANAITAGTSGVVYIEFLG
ncbi:MAG: hypothetical protein HDT21_06985 [Ruminococcus sp.]|nr:hypothetical protein [Ruminococcus sp.]